MFFAIRWAWVNFTWFGSGYGHDVIFRPAAPITAGSGWRPSR